MPEETATANEALLRAGRLVLAGQAELDAHLAVGAPVELLCAVLERVATGLAALVRPEEEGREPRRTLLSWRDHLSSHVLAARALNEIEVDTDLQAHLLERGLAEVSASYAAIFIRA
jgi:hypothetical protein